MSGFSTRPNYLSPGVLPDKAGRSTALLHTLRQDMANVWRQLQDLDRHRAAFEALPKSEQEAAGKALGFEPSSACKTASALFDAIPAHLPPPKPVKETGGNK